MAISPVADLPNLQSRPVTRRLSLRLKSPQRSSSQDEHTRHLQEWRRQRELERLMLDFPGRQNPGTLLERRGHRWKQLTRLP